MAGKKNDNDLLAERMRALSGGTKPSANRGATQQNTAPPKPVRNKPRAERKEAFKQGMLVSASGEQVQIVLKNISQTGARVDFFRGGSAIAGQAVLSVPTLGLKRKVRIAWKDQNSAGLEFLD